MPFLFLVVGTLFVVSAVRGTNADLVSLLKADFTGKDNYIYWLLSILLIGAVGYIPGLKPVSRAFLVLVVVVLFIKKGTNAQNGGVFQKFLSAIGQTQTVNASPTTIGATPQQLQNPSTQQQGFAQSVNLENELGPLQSL